MDLVVTEHTARFEELTTRQLHELLRVRMEVFVVEQECAYPEIDGRDMEPDTEHLWVEVGGEVAALVRVLAGSGVTHVGRVATARQHRGNGYAGRLLRTAIRRCGDVPIEIGAQAHLEQWYRSFGFERSGPDYLEDGIAHLPMRREPESPPTGTAYSTRAW